MDMNQRQKADLDKHITGNYGEDQFKNEEKPVEVKHNQLAQKLRETEVRTVGFRCTGREFKLLYERGQVEGMLVQEVLQSLVHGYGIGEIELPVVVLNRAKDREKQWKRRKENDRGVDYRAAHKEE